MQEGAQEEGERAEEERTRVTRRSVLSASAGAAAAVGGLGMLAEPAAAWEWFEAEFRSCSEVWLVVGESDLRYDPPLVVNVVVARGDRAECRRVEITEENATTAARQCGDAPLVEYSVPHPERILGVVHYTPYVERNDRYYPRCLTRNDHDCSGRHTPDPEFTDCVDADLAECDRSTGTRCLEDWLGHTLQSLRLGRR